MEWVKLQTLFDSKEKALKTASIVATTESRLASEQRGPQYEVETTVEQVQDKWQVSWRKVLVGFKTGGCGGCQSCQAKPPVPKQSGQNKGKVIPFKRPAANNK